MNLHVFIIHISIALFIIPGAFSKTLSERIQIDSENEADQNDENSDESAELHETHHHSFRHNKDDHIKKHARRGRSSLQDNQRKFAIMYKQEEPVGILQHFHDSYQLLPIHTDESIPVDVSPVERMDDESSEQDNKKREITEFDEDTPSQNDDLVGFADEKYPYIFAKFKIDTKVEKENQKARALEKRETKLTKKRPLFNDKHISSLNSALSRVRNNDGAANLELRSILHDMGLIEEPHLDKRDAELIEDENLEHGTNKINLIKVDNGEDSKPKPAKRSNDGKSTTKHYEMIQYPEPKSLNEEKVIDEYMNQLKQSQDKEDDKEREKRASDDIEEQMEKRIKERLQKIKEEVRSEIDKLKANNNEEVNEDKEELDKDEGKAQRRKRNIINTLVEEETSDLNPVIVGDENPVPHVRRRRSVDPSTYLSRNLLEVSNDEYDFEDFEDIRDKRSCKCESGKDCKCGKPKTYLGALDGSEFVYFNGAPIKLHSGVNQIHQQDFKSAKDSSKPEQKRAVSHLEDGKYKLDLHPESYKITKDNSDWVNSFRKKRSGFLDLVALHGGGPVLDHLVAVRQRSMLPKIRQKRMTQVGGRPLTLIDMSENDLFGAEPENFEGDELVRLKRVKRVS